MAIQGLEYLLIVIVIFFIVWYILKFLRNRKLDNALTRALTVIKSRGTATIDDLIVYGNISPSYVYKVIDKLIELNLVNIVEREEGISYFTLRHSTDS